MGLTDGFIDKIFGKRKKKSASKSGGVKDFLKNKLYGCDEEKEVIRKEPC